MPIEISTHVTEDRIKGLLCCAFEGGSNYWCKVTGYEFGNSGLTYDNFREGGSQQGEDYWHPCQLIPLVEGCAVLIEDSEAFTHETFRLDKEAIAKGLTLMATNYPKHWADFISENDDAETGDVFLQLCLFGEIKFG